MGNSSPYTTLILIALMVVAFYFLIIRPNKRRQQAQQRTMSSLTPGTRVLLTSGVFGTLVEIGVKQAVIELSPGVHLTVLKQAIARAVREGDEDPVDDDSLDGDLVVYHPNDPAVEPDGDLTASDAAPNDLSGRDSDPRSGTNTSPIKD